MQDLKALEGKSLAELREIAKTLGIKNVMRKKRELIAAIAGPALSEEAAASDAQSAAAGETAAAAPQPRAPRGRRPRLANRTGGFSGPAVKPIAVRMVYEVAQAVRVPIIGMGGIMDGADAVEFLLAGASAVAVGTANFVDPYAPLEVIDGIDAYLERHGCASVKEIVGGLRVD